MKILYVLLLLGLCLISLKQANAQQVSLSISPPLIEATMKPGKAILIAYTLQNIDDPTIITAKIRPFIAQGTQGYVRIKSEFEGPIQFSLDNSDLQLDQPFFLKSHQTQQLLLRIRVPEGTPEGDYYYTLLNETQPPPQVEGVTSSRAQAAIGANILITVTESGKIDINGKITIFDTLLAHTLSIFGYKIKLYDSNDVIPVVLQVNNKGKNLIKSSGEIVLKGNLGEKATYSIEPQNILSESQRIISASPSASVNCEEGKNKRLCSFPYSFLLSGFFIGKYQLSTTVNFGEGSSNLYASTSFIALPIKFISIFAIVLIICASIVIKIKTNNREE